MDIESKKRFHLTHVQPATKAYLEQFIAKYKLEGPIRKDDFYLPDDTNMDAAERFLVAFAEQVLSGKPVNEMDVAGFVQRVVWMSGEIGAMKRTNRNLRSKNLRLRKERDNKPTTGFIPTAEQKQLLLRTKHLDRPELPERPTVKLLSETGKQVGEIRLDNTPAVYQPLPDPNAVYDENGKAIPQHPPRGR